jgi:hypothetical protein
MLRRYTWEKTKEKLQHYRRRAPEATPLCHIVYHSRDDLSVTSDRETTRRATTTSRLSLAQWKFGGGGAETPAKVIKIRKPKAID